MPTKKPNYKALTMKLTGMSEQQYAKAQKAFAKRVANYNRVTGDKYSATKEFYYKYRYAGSPSRALKAIESMTATQSHKKGGEAPTKTQLKLAREAVVKQWLPDFEKRKQKGLADKWTGSEMEKIYNRIYEKNEDGSYKYTAAEVNQQLKDFAEEVKQHRSGEAHEDAPIYGS